MKEQQLAIGGGLCLQLCVRILSRGGSIRAGQGGGVFLTTRRARGEAGVASPALLARMELLPAEKMLAAVDPGLSVPLCDVVARHAPA